MTLPACESLESCLGKCKRLCTSFFMTYYFDCQTPSHTRSSLRLMFTHFFNQHESDWLTCCREEFLDFIHLLLPLVVSLTPSDSSRDPRLAKTFYTSASAEWNLLERLNPILLRRPNSAQLYFLLFSNLVLPELLHRFGSWLRFFRIFFSSFLDSSPSPVNVFPLFFGCTCYSWSASCP